jgi:hypothetical protein
MHRHKIEIVPSRIPLQDKDRFDAEHLGWRRQSDGGTFARDGLGFQGLLTDELPNAGHNTVETAENLIGTLDPASLPPSNRFKFREDRIETLFQIGNDVIGID